MHWRGIPWVLGLIGRGEFGLLASEAWARLYRQYYSAVFRRQVARARPPVHPLDSQIRLETRHPIAFQSPDHLVPWGTRYDNSTNRKFVLHMERLIAGPSGATDHAFVDYGCSGGQLVKDFRDLGWLAVGLEGSDYSLKHKRACWAELAHRNLFTCDVTKPYHLLAGGQPAQFDLATAWEVIEHIHLDDLPRFYASINAHLKRDGYFVASTNSSSDIHDGVELHQSRFTNAEWRQRIAGFCPDWEPADLGLKYYQYVRFSYPERSFLAYRKT